MNKNYKTDFDKFKEKIEKGIPFALSRCNDGEMIIMNNEYINLLNKCNGEFIYDPNIKSHHFYRQQLIDSAKYKADNYYVGIACRCCVGNEKHENLKNLTGQDENHLTWGNIFVNGNYNRYLKEILPLFRTKCIEMVVNKNANVNNLSFDVNNVFTVGTNAWMENQSLIDELEELVRNTDNSIDGYASRTFLIAAGTFSNIIIHRLHKANPNLQYIDIGSTLDSIMGLGNTRGYLAGAPTLNKICVW